MKKVLVTILLFLTTTLFATPHAVVFDFGGVMTFPSNHDQMADFIFNTFKFSSEEYEKAKKDKKIVAQYGKSYEEFWLEYAEIHHVSLPEEWVDQYRSSMAQVMEINQQMYILVDQLKQLSIHVAMLSNIDPDLSKTFRAANLYAPFDPCLLSCELALSKPDPQIYRLLLDTLGLPAQDVVFIDDKEENVKAAQTLGIDAILFESYEQLLKELAHREIII